MKKTTDECTYFMNIKLISNKNEQVVSGNAVCELFWQRVVYTELWMQIPSGGLFIPSNPDWRLEIGQWDIC